MADAVGMIGLGEMGLPMARNLLKGGFAVVGIDVSEAARERARAAGAQVVRTVAEVAQHATRAVLCIVRDLPQTEAVLFGDEGLASSGRSGLVVVVMSTLSPAAMRAVGERAQRAGFPVLDAPVSGARVGAEAGTLTIMVAGPREHHEACLPYFKAMGKNVFHLGDEPGAGQAAKLANNLMLAAAMVGCAEGMRYGARHGLSEDRLLDLLRVSTGNSWVVQHWEDVRRWWAEYRPGATLDIVAKDLKAIVNECNTAGSPLALTDACFGALMDARDRPRS